MPKKNLEATRSEYSSLVPAVAQASRIFLCLAGTQSASMTLTEVSREVGIHKSKAYSILNTLQHFNLVQRDPRSKEYSLGTGLLFLSSKVLSSLDVRTEAAPLLEKLSRETNNTAFLGLISQSHLFVVARDEGNQDIGLTIRLGHRFPLAWGAHGKAIASGLPETEREELLAKGKLYFHGSPEKFDQARLEIEIAKCRERGFAADLGDMKTGLHVVAAPVFGPSAKVIGALVVLGTFPKGLAARYGALVANAAKELSEWMGGFPGLSVRAQEPRRVVFLEATQARKEE